MLEQSGRMLRGIWVSGCSHEVRQALLLSQGGHQIFTGSEALVSTVFHGPHLPSQGGVWRHVIWTQLVKGFESKCGSQAVLR